MVGLFLEWSKPPGKNEWNVYCSARVNHPGPKTLLRYVFERPLLKTGGEVLRINHVFRTIALETYDSLLIYPPKL